MRTHKLDICDKWFGENFVTPQKFPTSKSRLYNDVILINDSGMWSKEASETTNTSVIVRSYSKL